MWFVPIAQRRHGDGTNIQVPRRARGGARLLSSARIERLAGGGKARRERAAAPSRNFATRKRTRRKLSKRRSM
jgi:hypothetical protein